MQAMRQSRTALHALSGREWSLLLACAVTILLFSVASPYFATSGNAGTILRNSIELLLAGLGMTLLLAMGGIDVSIGIVMGLAAIGVGNALGLQVNPVLTALIGPAIGAALGFITAMVNFAVMSSAKGNRELIADLAAKRPRLRKTQMVSISGTPAADQARLLGN